MSSRSWVCLLLAVSSLGCRSNSPLYKLAEAEHESGHDAQEKKFAWGPAAPEPPLTPSPLPVFPDQTGPPKSPGDGPQMLEDKLIPSTADPATPK